jgi:hypothetical protein
MIELIDSGWSSQISERAKERHGKVRVVCPFIKRRAAKRLLDEGHRPEIRVITRFNLSDFSAGVSDISAMRWLMDQGARIRGIKGLHSKMYLFGDHHSIVTSANLTEAAMFRNQEFGFVSHDEIVAERCHAYFDRLWELAGTNLTHAKLDDWEKQLRAAVAGGAKPPPGPGLPDLGTSVPQIEVPGMGMGQIPIPPLFSEAEQAFVKFLGTSDDRWPITTSVLEGIEDSDCHRVLAYPKSKRPNIVQTGAIMFIARLIDDGDIMIFGRAIAIKHAPGIDEATADDIAHLDWMKTWTNFIRVHHAEFLDGTLEGGVRLSELMAQLGTDSFASTQERAAKGEKGIVPHRAYGQQPAVRLSKEGLDWLNARLEQAFQDHGKLPPEALQDLNWP